MIFHRHLDKRSNITKFKKVNNITSSDKLQDSDLLKKTKFDGKYKINMIGEQNKYQLYGSSIGKVINFMGMIFSIFLFLSTISTMLNRRKDSIQQFTISNDFKEFGEFDMNLKNFLPFIIAYKNRAEITSDDYDIFDQNQPIPADTISPIYINPSKLSRYFDFKIIFNENESIFYHQTFKTCTKNDFEKNGIDQFKFIDVSLCPDLSKFKEHYKVKNDFSYDAYNYLEIAAIPCDSKFRQDCAPNEKINSIFDDFWFQLYMIEEYVDLSDPSLYEAKPVKTKVKYIQEMQFERSKYQNHHFSLVHNFVETSDQRFELWKDYQIFEYFTVSILSGYTSVPYKEVQYSTSDGINFEDIEYELVWLAYITLDANRVIHKRNVYHILNALGEFGGLQSQLITIFLIFAMDINYNLMTGDFIQNLYFPFQQKETNKYHFSLQDQLKNIWFLKPILCFFKAKNKQQFENLKMMLEQQMNMINMLSRIQKLGIMVSTLITVDEKSKIIAEQKYLNHLQQVQYNSEFVDDIFSFIDNFGKQNLLNLQNIQKIDQDEYVSQGHDGNNRTIFQQKLMVNFFSNLLMFVRKMKQKITFKVRQVNFLFKNIEDESDRQQLNTKTTSLDLISKKDNIDQNLQQSDNHIQSENLFQFDQISKSQINLNKSEQQISLSKILKLDGQKTFEDNKEEIKDSNSIQSNNYIKLNNEIQGQTIFESYYLPSHISEIT